MSWFVEFAFKCYILFFFYSRDENFQRSTFLKFLVTLDFLSKFIRPCIYIHFWRHDVALSLQSGNDGMEYIFLARDRARRKTILIVLPIFYVTQAAWAPPPTPSFSFSPTHPPPPCTFLCLVRLTQKWHCRCYRTLPWTTLCCSSRSVFEQYVTCCRCRCRCCCCRWEQAAPSQSWRESSRHHHHQLPPKQPAQTQARNERDTKRKMSCKMSQSFF